MLTEENRVYTSEYLVEGKVYTRADLKKQFGITDTTLNTGVFRPSGSNSIWLFITEKKPSDRTPYKDLLADDILQWQGQMKGRTDQVIVQHSRNATELLVFYRRRKYEYTGAGFRYEGRFEYRHHTGSLPASFILHRLVTGDDIEVQQVRLEEAGDFDPVTSLQGKEKVFASIASRRGQRAFRVALMQAYSGCCAVTGCSLQAVLEAAHIIPYQGAQTNHIQNGVLLRADIHTLFDLHLIAVESKDMSLLISPELNGTEYENLSGSLLKIPIALSHRPSRDALRMHRAQCKF
jgi:putative restriction endonuclease